MVLLLLALLACRSPGLGDSGPLLSDGGSADGGGSTDGGGLDGGATDGGGSDGGGSDGGAFDSLCPSAEGRPEELALWATDGFALSFLRLDGTLVEGHRFFADLDTSGISGGVQAVVHQPGYLAAVAGSYRSAADPDEVELWTELAFFDEAGTLLWTWREEGVLSSRLWLGADGTLAWDRGYPGMDGGAPRLPGRAFRPGGEEELLEGWPIGEPIDGSVPRCDGIDCSWDDPFRGLAEGQREDLTPNWTLSLPGALLWPMAGLEFATLVLERPGELVQLSLPELEGDQVPALAARAGSWAVVHHEGQAWRVDLAARRAERIAPTLPEGQRLFEGTEICPALPPGVAPDGSLLIALRDEPRGALWRTDLAGSAWEKLGQDVTDTLYLRGGAEGGSSFVQAIGAEETFCGAMHWDEDSAALGGSSLQLLRGEGAWTLGSLPGGTQAASPFAEGGACALVQGDAGPTILDLGTGEAVDAPGAAGWLLER